jgi:hypothetical protein
MSNADLAKLLEKPVRAIWVVTVFQDGSTSVVKQL